MRHGFIKVSACTPSLRLADCAYNGERIIELMAEARERGSNIAVFPELCITGSTCGDLFAQKALTDEALKCLKRIAEATEGSDMLTFVGLPLRYGGRLLSVAAAVQSGEIRAIIPKSSSDYPLEGCDIDLDCFSGEGISAVLGREIILICGSLPSLRVGCLIGEEIASPDSPDTELAMLGTTVIVCMGSEPELDVSKEERLEHMKARSRQLRCAFVYAGADMGESSTDFVYSGHKIICENGEILAESELFGEDRITTTEIDTDYLEFLRIRRAEFAPKGRDFEEITFKTALTETKLTRYIPKTPFIPEDENEMKLRCGRIIELQARGLKRRLEHINAKCAVIGVSGGLDSTLALLVAVNAANLMGKDEKYVTAVTMPCFGTSKRTKNNALRLCELLGTTLYTVDISEAVKVHLRDIGLDTDDRSVTFENAQARERTQVLMDMSNRLGGIVVGTGDLSELALGFTTYNGDHMSMYGVNSTVPKTLMRKIVLCEADRLGGELADVLRDIVNTPVSPELLPGRDGEIAQKTESIVGPYELVDFILYYGIGCGYPPEKVKRAAKYAFEDELSDEEIEKRCEDFYRRFFNNQFKRSCLPDSPATGAISLSPRKGFNMPSDGWSTVWRG